MDLKTQLTRLYKITTLLINKGQQQKLPCLHYHHHHHCHHPRRHCNRCRHPDDYLDIQTLSVWSSSGTLSLKLSLWEDKDHINCFVMIMIVDADDDYNHKIELKTGCSTLRRKLRRDETTAGWCTDGPWTTSSLTRRNKKIISFTRLSLGFPGSACFGRSSPWAAADQEISRGDYKEYNIADLCRGC